MTVLTIRHVTVYRYARPVEFGDHRLMFRPRDSHDLRLIDTALVTAPPAQVSWQHDVFGNSIAIATFANHASELRFESTFVAKHYVSAEPAFSIADHAQQIPFSYSAEAIPDLGRTIERHFPDPDHAVDRWVRQFLLENGATETHRLLVELTTAVKHQFAYVPREEPGVQTPAETLGRGSGSCRDFVVLMMEAVRSLGLAARFVSGYLYDPALDGSASEVTGAGSTHAWVQIYLPGAGWVECDPTNGTLGGANLIRVAVVREPGQAVPIQGTFVGGPDDFIGMDVEVTVNSMPST